jgi:hypothetical protein
MFQIFCIQCRLFENMNVVIGCHYVHTSATFSRLLQPNVMHIFSQIVNGHVGPLFITELLRIKGKERPNFF